MTDITLTLPAVAPTAGQVLKADASTPTTLTWAADSATDSTKMPLAGGTFTGDVTFTGDSSNVVWDKSASAFTGTITATAFSGPLTGNITGNVSGSAATVTSAAQSAITSLGTLTGLTVDGDVTFTGASSNGSWDKSANAFVGNLTGTASNNAVLTGSTNNTIATVTGANALQGEANLTYDGSTLALSGDDNQQITIGASADLTLKADGSNSAIAHNGDGDFYIKTDGTGEDVILQSKDILIFRTDGNNERMRIDSSGRLLIGTTAAQHNSADQLQVAATSSTASLGLNRYTANAYPSYINFFKSRSGTLSGQTVVQDGDILGQITWAGSDGTNRAYAAFIDARVDGTPGDGDMPGRLVFSTSADGSESPSERMRIDSSGQFYLGRTNQITIDSQGSNSVFEQITDNKWPLALHAAETNKRGLGVFYADTGAGDTGDPFIYCTNQTSVKFKVDSAGSATFAGTVSDSKGELRTIPQLSKSSAHTIVAADAGQHSINSSGGWVINTSTGFTAGQAITLINNSSGDQTITSTGVTLYNSADGSTPTKIATRGMATVICTASNTYYISGAGLS